jgi:hypothetical protein
VGNENSAKWTKILSTTLSHFCLSPSRTFTLNCYTLLPSLSLSTHSLFVSFRPCSAASTFLLQHLCFNMSRSRCRFTIHSTISSIRFLIEKFPRKNVLHHCSPLVAGAVPTIRDSHHLSWHYQVRVRRQRSSFIFERRKIKKDRRKIRNGRRKIRNGRRKIEKDRRKLENRRNQPVNYRKDEKDDFQFCC